MTRFQQVVLVACLLVGVVTLGLVYQIADDTLTSDDVVTLAAFLGGGGFVWAMTKEGRPPK